MKFDNSLRHSYVQMVRGHRSQILFEWQKIEQQKMLLRNSHAREMITSNGGPMMKTYLRFSAWLKMYQYESREAQRLLSLRNEQERELHQLKVSLHPVDSDYPECSF